ncbi:MAG: hypothetical protein OEV42_03000 [Deltaproteobacteria bacterium]|nr:hypothetical protein [Deltaproteobacteria bacterium]
MKKIYSLLCLLIVLFFLTGTLYGAEEEQGHLHDEMAHKTEEGEIAELNKEDKERLLEELMEKSGINRQLEAIPLYIKRGFRTGWAQSGQARGEALNKSILILGSAFYPGKLQVKIRKAFDIALGADEISDLLQWFDSPLGRAIVSIETDVFSGASVERKKAMMNQLMQSRQGTVKMERMKRLEKATKATERAVNMALNMEIAMSMAMLGAFKPSNDEALNALEKEALTQRPELEKSMEEKILSGFLYNYRLLKNNEIEKYIAFSESSYGRKFIETFHMAITESLTNAGREAGRAIGEYLKNKNTR